MNLRPFFFQYIAQTSPEPMALEISNAAGIYLIDQYGKRYIDFISGIGVSNLGHKNQTIISAIHEQTDKYLHTLVYGEHIQSPQVLLAKKLVENLPNHLNNVYFLNSGAEAVDAALKLARKTTGRSEILAFKNSYHGSTFGAMSLMSDPERTQPFAPLLPNIRQIEFNAPDIANHISSETACVILEIVQAEAGILLPQAEFLKSIRAKCIETGTLLILDEIQTGYGRTGQLFAFEKYGISPDILLLAKSFGGGMPLSALITDRAIANHFKENPPLGHLTTFGGHPVSCAAGLAALTLLTETNIVEESNAKAKYFIEKLKHSAIKEIRSTGLWMAIDLGNADKVKTVIARCLKNGLILDWFLFNDQSIRIAPPLTIEYEELDLAVNILLSSLD